jgi:integrase
MAHSFKVRIGIREVTAMQPHTILWDQEVRGFCCRRQNSKTITFSVFYRTKDHSQKWYKLGRFPILTPHIARTEAIRVLKAVTLGEDPSAERKELRHGMTVAQLCDEYSARDNGKKPATIRSDTSRIKLHIKPKLGNLNVTAITSEQIEDFVQSLSVGSQARCIGLLGVMFEWAVKRKLRTDNPCRGIEKPADVKRNRRLSDIEYTQLGTALNGGIVSDIFLLLAVTGFRSSEARLLKWSECDLFHQIATLADTKTGISIRPLSSAAIEIINRQPKNDMYVFGKCGNIRYPWLKLGMPLDITPHSLGHSFASLGADMGLSDNSIATLIGHARQSITSRYLHLGDKASIENANLLANETLKLMGRS